MANPKEEMEITRNAMSLLDLPGRRYVYNQYVKEHHEKKYIYVPYDIRLYRHAADHYGGTSDCYIMYAIANLGLADFGAIFNFLKALKKLNPELKIIDLSNKDAKSALRGRLNTLFNQGFVFRHIYQTSYINAEGNECYDDIYIYSMDRESQAFMTQRLGKRVPPNTWIQAKSIEDVIAWAACTYVGTAIAQNDAFLDFKEGIFSTKNLGTCYVPCELKTSVDGQDFYTIVLPVFMILNTDRMTKDDYLDSILRKLNTIVNYVHYRHTYKKLARIVLVVEDKEDFRKIVELIPNSQPLLDNLDKIYFTGEGLIKSKKLTMFQIKVNAKGEPICSLKYPDFIV